MESQELPPLLSGVSPSELQVTTRLRGKSPQPWSDGRESAAVLTASAAGTTSISLVVNERRAWKELARPREGLRSSCRSAS